MRMLLLILIGIPGLIDGNPHPPDLNAWMQTKVAADEPGLAIGIVKDGEIAFAGHQGMANLEHQIAAGPASRYNIASLAKQFTALCILKLALEQKLDLRDDIGKYFPHLYNDLDDTIRIGHLLTHTSGIRDLYDLLSLEGRPWWARVGYDMEDARTLLAKQTSLNHEPGERHLYSNSGYLLLAEIVATTSGLSFHDYTRALFDDLGLTSTGFSNDYMAVIPNKSLPYSNWGNGTWKQYPMVVDLYGDGFLYTTLEDQLKWEGLLQAPPSSWTALLTDSQARVPGFDTWDYGFGLEFTTYKGYQLIEHAGATGSYGAHVMRFPEESLSIVVMTNNGNLWAGGLARELADLLLADTMINEQAPTWQTRMTSTSPDAEAICGRYWLDASLTLVKIYQQNDTLYRAIRGREPVKLLPLEGNVYYYETVPELKIVFTQDATDQSIFELHQDGLTPRIATPLSDPNPEDRMLTTLPGNYYNASLDLHLTLSPDTSGGFLILWDNQETPVQLIAKDRLAGGQYCWRLQYDGYGRISGLQLDYGRIRQLLFAKTGPVVMPTHLAFPDGTSISLATTKSDYGLGNGDLLLTRNDTAGNELWFKTYGGSGYDKGVMVLSTADGGYLLLGNTSSFGAGNYDALLIKTDALGEVEWQQTYGGPWNDYGISIASTGKGYQMSGNKQICAPGKEPLKGNCTMFRWEVLIDATGKIVEEQVFDINQD